MATLAAILDIRLAPFSFRNKDVTRSLSVKNSNHPFRSINKKIFKMFWRHCNKRLFKMDAVIWSDKHYFYLGPSRYYMNSISDNFHLDNDHSFMRSCKNSIFKMGTDVQFLFNIN